MASIDRENPEFMLEIQRRDMLDTKAAMDHMLMETRALPHANGAYLATTSHWARSAKEGAEYDVGRGRFHDAKGILTFLQAGNATLTIQSKKTDIRFTFKFVRPEPKEGKPRPTWVRLLNGPNNEGDYQFLGTMWGTAPELAYKHSAKSRVSQDAPSMVALRWLIRALVRNNSAALDQCEVYHEGRCGRCGRKLTVPESIESGFGPECIQRV